MEKLEIYNLIDSLSGLQYIPASQLTEKVIVGISEFCKPLAALIKAESPKVQINDKYVGEKTYRATLEGYMDKLSIINAGSAEFVPESGSRNIIICVSMNYPDYVKGAIGVVISPDNPLKHIIRQIIEIYGANMMLSLTAKSIGPRPGIALSEILTQGLENLKQMGVEAILGINPNRPNEAEWVESQSVRQIKLSQDAADFLLSNTKLEEATAKNRIISILPTTQQFGRLVKARFASGGGEIICIFAGKFANDEVIFSKFRGYLADYDQPSGYSQLAEAFKRLKEDHKLIVKGERIAAILETAVAVNHEVNNPLTAVLGNAQLLLLQKDKLPEDIVAKIMVIEKSALRIRQVTQKLMAIVEPVTTSYVDGLNMLDIDKSLSTE